MNIRNTCFETIKNDIFYEKTHKKATKVRLNLHVRFFFCIFVVLNCLRVDFSHPDINKAQYTLIYGFV